MKTFKNKNFAKRDFESTNIVVCQSEIAPNENWIEVDASVINEMNLQKLWIQSDAHYFGYL